MKHTLSVLVEDESGVLTRIAGLFARRGFNIESLAVGPAEQAGISRITMVVPAEDKTIDQLTKQLYKLVNKFGGEKRNRSISEPGTPTSSLRRRCYLCVSSSKSSKFTNFCSKCEGIVCNQHLVKLHRLIRVLV